ncbi:Ger(x)C family spore germination protein [Paenibacillus flagellatus]|uniref:Ger(X)C family spore germination protein n=1 Tax=Paenibacillus flagellatus TaxID=2211139 RepID=A0A2V5K6N7_9BACL|nr:Ger(x)C family spore germination protein [Paenibacillus flagellatus]PYI54948.1 Ger(x)C family spore germination protein [Paenibacillus flagellatus]
MPPKRTALLLSILALALLSGCWSRKEINEIQIITGVGIDKVDEVYLLTLQAANAGAISPMGGGRQSATVNTFEMRAESVMKAMRKLTTISPREMYFSHIRALVIGESVARDGVRDVLDVFLRDYQFRPDFYVLVTKEVRANEVMNVLSPLEPIPANKLFKTLETAQQYWAPAIGVHLDHFVDDLIREGVEPVLQGVTISGEPSKGKTTDNIKMTLPDTYLKFGKLGVFRNDRLVGWLNEEESAGYNYIVNDVEGTVSVLPCESGGQVAIETIRSRTKLTGSVAGGKPEMIVEIWAEGNVGDVECRIDLSKTRSIYELERKAEQSIKHAVDMAVKAARDTYKSDIFGFGQTLYRDRPKEWKKMKPNWEKVYPTVSVSTKVDVKLRRSGKIGKSFIQEMK